MSDSNIKDWLEDAVAVYGEPLEAVVVGTHNDHTWNEGYPLPDENVILDVPTALAKLDLDFDSGFGGADCFPIVAWTKSRVFFIQEYDGATSLGWLPRNPMAVKPEFSGQRVEETK